MALPVDPSIPYTPPTRFNSEFPPSSPNVNILDTVLGYKDMIASAVANYFTDHCRENHFWTFNYNLVSYNNYNNEFFAEAVRIACNFVSYGMINGQQLNGNNFGLLIEKGVCAAASKFAYMYINDLQPFLDPTMIQSIMHNSQAAAQLDVVLEPYFVQQETSKRIPVNNFGHGSISPIGSVGAAPRPHPAVASAAEIKPVRTTATKERVGLTPINQSKESSNRSNAMHERAPAVKTEPIKKTEESNEVEKGIENMDPSKHAIAYCDVVSNVSLGALQTSYSSEADALKELSKQDEIANNAHVFSGLLQSDSLEGAIESVMLTYAKTDPEKINIFTANCMVGIPIITPVDLRPLIERICKEVNLFGIVKVLQDYMKEEHESSRLAAMAVSQMDRVITESINDLLAYEFNIEGRMTQMTDLDQLEKILRNNNQPHHYALFKHHQEQVAKNIIAGFEFLSQDLDRVEDGVYIFSIYKAVNITYIQATHHELGYEIAKNKMMQIVAGNTPVFHKVADAITQLAIKGTYRSTENYIVTSDRVIYRVAQDTANPDNHNIVRV